MRSRLKFTYSETTTLKLSFHHKTQSTQNILSLRTMQPSYVPEDNTPNDSNSSRSSSPRRDELERISTATTTAATTEGTITFIPTLGDFDIACSQDQTYATHSGNRLFRQHVESVKFSYKEAKTKTERMKITKGLVKEVKNTYGSRFLKRHDNGMWVEISLFDARDKVGHAIRFALRKFLAATKSDNTDAAGGSGGGGGDDEDMGMLSGNSSSNRSSPITAPCETATEDATFAAASAAATTAAASADVAWTTTTTATTKNDGESPSSSCEDSATREFNVNELLTGPLLYLDEYDSGPQQHQQHPHHHQQG
jgi:hypothetical protein